MHRFFLFLCVLLLPVQIFAGTLQSAHKNTSTIPVTVIHTTLADTVLVPCMALSECEDNTRAQAQYDVEEGTLPGRLTSLGVRMLVVPPIDHALFAVSSRVIDVFRPPRTTVLSSAATHGR